MATSAAQKLANARYRQNKRKTVGAEVSREKGELIQAFATSIGISTSRLVQVAIEDFISRHENGAPIGGNFTAKSEQTLTTEQKIFVDEFSKLPADVQKHFLKVFKAINAHLPK